MTIVELPDLIVPRKVGFWRVGVRTLCDPKSSANFDTGEKLTVRDAWFAEPVAKRPVVTGLVPCPADAEDPCLTDSTTVKFVNSEYISLQEGEETSCGAQPDGSSKWSVMRLGDHTASPLAFSAIEGSEGREEYKKLAARALIENERGIYEQDPAPGAGNTEEDQQIRKTYSNWSSMTEVEKVAAMQGGDDACFPEHNEAEWYIQRNQGGWAAYGAFDTHRLCGVEVNFQLPLRAPFAMPAEIPISLAAIKEQITGAYDAFWLDNQKVVIVLVGNGAVTGEPFPSRSSLEVFWLHGPRLGKPIVTMSLLEFEGLVMAESTTGSNVERWTEELKKIKVMGLVKPLMAPSPPQ